MTIILLIVIGLCSCVVTGCQGDKLVENGVSSHFTFDYADDIKATRLFDTVAERETYKAKALSEMDALFRDFHKRFGFAPDHAIHVTLSETVNGGKNAAYTTVTYSSDGSIVKLTMHFPHQMFDRKFVRAHELTHAFVAPFNLPTWVNEGFAVLVENFYSDTPRHRIFDSLENNIRLDTNGINAVQHWTEGQGIYADADMTQWCYRYSHTIVNYIEKKYPGTFAKVFETVNPSRTFTTKAFISVVDKIITKTDMVAFFTKLGFTNL
ncbi:MAG: hypothetical protein F4118_12365 [Acidimicrobiaceae bacterium]|nr:hypothetical protein [Acidimicrobiaceae bacterium]